MACDRTTLARTRPTRSLLRTVCAADIVDEYTTAFARPSAHERAKWGTRQGMLSRFRLGCDIIDWSGVRSWLDIGCGEGLFFQHAERLGRRFERLIGVDITPPVLQAAAAAGYTSAAQFVRADLAQLPTCATHDLVTLVGVLQQCGSPPAVALSAAAGALRPGGQLFLTTKHLGWRAFTRGWLQPDAHHSWFDLQELLDVLADAQVDVVACGGLLPRLGRRVRPARSHTVYILGIKRGTECTGVAGLQRPAVLVCAAGGPRIGYGHIQRTLGIAEALREDHRCHVTYALPPDSDDRRVHHAGFAVQSGSSCALDAIRQHAPSRGPVLIDDRAIAEDAVAALRSAGYVTVCFQDDGRPARRHADVVLDYACSWSAEHPLVAAGHGGGPQYFPLRRAVVECAADTVVDPAGPILITMGGSDPDDATAALVAAARAVPPEWVQAGKPAGLRVLLGPGYTGGAADRAAGCPWIEIVRDAPHIGVVAQRVSLAICAAGGTAYELAFLGIPQLLIVLADDQCGIADQLTTTAAADVLGHIDTLDAAAAWQRACVVRGQPHLLQAQVRAGRDLVDGRGARRCAQRILRAWTERRCDAISE